MKLVEYKLHASVFGRGKTTPAWINHGGHYMNPDDHTLMGFVEDPCEYYLPDTLEYYTLPEAVTRQLAIHAKHPMNKMDHETGELSVMTEAEVQAQMEDWYNAITS